MEDKKLSELGFKNVNLYFSAICNLKCRYCFQPKIMDLNVDTNKRIIDWISSGKMEDDILALFGDGLTSISLWGGEPSINLPYLTDRLSSLYNNFPKVDTIQYSTNLSAESLCKNTINFIRAVDHLNKKEDRHVKVDLQLSLDGPAEINDYSRIGSKASEIVDNITHLCESLKDIDKHCYMLSLKGTQSKDTLKWLITDNNLEYFYNFFADNETIWRSVLKEKAPRNGSFITLVYPGNYTQEDGRVFLELCKKQNSVEFRERFKGKSVTFDNQVSSRIKASLTNLRAGYYRPYKGELLRCTTCSAGSSSLGLSYDGLIHLCHSTYMFSPEVLNYIEKNNIVSEFESVQGFSFKNFKSSIENNMVVHKEDKPRLYRLLHTMNVCNEDVATKLQYFEIMLSQLATAGQISDKYLDSYYRDLATSFLVFGGNECPVNNVWEFNSPYIRSTSQMKLVFNGAFEYFVDNFSNNILGIYR